MLLVEALEVLELADERRCARPLPVLGVPAAGEELGKKRIRFRTCGRNGVEMGSPHMGKRGVGDEDKIKM